MPENTATIGFEKQIWDAARILRGNLDASEYKHVVLGLIFLKYLSNRFDARRDELVAEGEGFEEDPDAYTEENVFFVPQEARWERVANAAHTPGIGKLIDDRPYQPYPLCFGAAGPIRSVGAQPYRPYPPPKGGGTPYRSYPPYSLSPARPTNPEVK